MRTQSFATVSNVLLVLICICISAFERQDVCIVKKEKVALIKTSFETSTDVLNPIYIFK